MFSLWLPRATSGSRTAGVTRGIATATQTHKASGAKQLFCPGARDLEKHRNKERERQRRALVVNMTDEAETKLAAGSLQVHTKQ